MNYKFSLEFLKLPLESGLEEYLRRKMMREALSNHSPF